MTPEQAETVARVRAAMKQRNSPVITREERLGLRALRLSLTTGQTVREAAAAFGVTEGAINSARQRLRLGPTKNPQENRARAEEAARYVHDCPRPITFAVAAQTFAVHHLSIVAAWKRLFPNEPRTRVG